MNKLIHTLLFLLFSLASINLLAQSAADAIIENEQETTWKGFKRYSFKYNQRVARLIVPNNPLPNNPWIWRARFPDWHTRADSILVAEGFHLAYINTNNQFGSPNAVAIWDNFYTFLTTKYQLQKKVALMGVSRGGLFIYNWAKKNPDKVACIYAEAPVCDFKSWPAGFGESEGNLGSWNRLKKEYGFVSDEAAKLYANNPIDNLATLAEAKVPILHMIGLKDEVVPVDENTFPLINNYIKLGGSVRVIPCTEGKQTAKGHHFPIETPRMVADFIKYHSLTNLPPDTAKIYGSPSGENSSIGTKKRPVQTIEKAFDKAIKIRKSSNKPIVSEIEPNSQSLKENDDDSNTSLLDLLDPTIYEVPKIFWESDKDEGDVKAMFYSTLPYKGKETRAFAYIGIPKNDKPVPAMVLVHGGGGKAFPNWVKMWNDRGYAAIAMSLEGHMPDSAGNGKHRHEYSGPKRTGRFDDMDLPLEEQWMYHAVSDIIIGHTLLASFPEVDANRIGVTGISWGGILSSLVSGVDSRYKCAMPVYGAGFLYESKGHFGDHGDDAPEFIEKKKFWDPSKQLTNDSVPILWVNSDSDGHFSLNITSNSFKLTSNHAFMSIHPSMPHGHKAGWDIKRIPELYAFADYYLKNEGTKHGQITQQPTDRNSILTYSSESNIVKATIYYLKEPLTYRSIEGEKHERPGPWLTKSAKVNATNKTVEIKLPEEVMTYYVNLEDEHGFIISSQLVEFEKG